MDDEYFDDKIAAVGQDGVNSQFSDSDLEEDCRSHPEKSIEGATDSEEEEMKELVEAAEKILAETSEFDTEEIVPQKNECGSDLTDVSPGVTLTTLTSLNEDEELHTRTFNMSSLPRKLDMKVPEEVNFEWLCSCVPLMTLKNEMKPLVAEAVKTLQQTLDQGDSAEEYKVS